MITELKIPFYPLREEGCIDCGYYFMISDERTGDKICKNCGVVQEERVMNSCYED